MFEIQHLFLAFCVGSGVGAALMTVGFKRFHRCHGSEADLKAMDDLTEKLKTIDQKEK